MILHAQRGTKVANVLGVVGLVSESSKPASVKPHCQLTVLCTESIYAEVEFLVPKQQRLMNVPLNYVRLCRFVCIVSLVLLRNIRIRRILVRLLLLLDFMRRH